MCRALESWAIPSHCPGDPADAEPLATRDVCGARARADDVRVRDSTEPLRVTYDDEVDAAYIYLVPEIEAGGVARTVPVDGGDDPGRGSVAEGSGCGRTGRVSLAPIL